MIDKSPIFYKLQDINNAEATRKNNQNNQKALNFKSDFSIASTFIVINAVKKIIN